MRPRPLSPEDRALWRRVVADVRPLRAELERELDRAPAQAGAQLPDTDRIAPPPARRDWTPASAGERAKPRPANTLDASWDRRLARGSIAPDRVIDLHGHTLAAAHATLDAALGQAVRAGDRVLLIVAGRDRPGPGRGAIRREVGVWLAASRHAARIAAVRGAHPRHGGAGAFYLILRRPVATPGG